MKGKKSLTTKKIVLTALMAALVFVGSALRVRLPIAVGSTTSFHLGNIFCALSGLLLGPWLGGLAAGLGSFLFDIMTNYISECWITFLTKGAYGLVAGLVAWKAGKMNWNYLKATVATTAAAITYAALYLGKSYLQGILVKGLTSDAALLAVIGKIPATVFNAVVAIIFAPILGLAILEGLKKSHLSLE